jgi:nucleotide-binding universal stress UspA family protein
MHTIVVGYDGSDAAKRALERAVELVENGASVTVVSAVPLTLPGKGAVKPYTPWEEEEHRQQLEEAKAALAAKGVASELVEGVGDAADVIVDQAREKAADLIVVGSRGKNLAERIALGSVSTKVVHHAPCDVLVVR